MAGNPPNLPTENIDEVILRLLALEPNEVDELDYETYRQYLKELLIEIDRGRKIGGDEAESIRDEFKRVKGKTGRFKLKSKKAKVTATGLGLGGIRKQVKGAQQRIMLMPVGGIPKGGAEVKEKVETVSKKKRTSSDPLIRISKTLDSILRTLTDINKENRKKSEKDRRDAESRRRGGREKDLESKRFEGIKKALSTITKPFQSIWDRIVNFITNIVLGRIVLKLLDWFADPNNQGKINSIIRFFSDHWPTLLALYIRFGTGIGRFVGKLTGIVIKGAIKLGAITARLLASAGLKKFGAAAKFLGGPRGRLLGAGLSAVATIGGTLALGKGIESLAGGGEEKTTPVPGFSGGGWNKGFKNFFGNMFSGLVKGPKGRDKVPAMLTDGEFVVSAGAVRKYGVDTFEAMNAAGGGTNIPQIAGGVTYAEGGGLIGDIPLASSYGVNPPVDTLRRAARTFSRDNRFGTEEDLFKAFKKLNGVPDFPKMVGGENNYSRIFQGHHGADDALDAIRKSVANKLKEVSNPKSFTQSSRAAAGLDDLANKFDMDAKTAPKYGENLPRLGRPKPKVTRIDPSKMLPSAGQSSANAMRAAAKAAQNVRAPIPASSAIVPYTGGGLARTGVTGGLSVPKIKTNMRVPGGFGNLKSLGAELLLSYLVQSGLDYVEAKRLASTIEKARKESPEKLANRIEKLRELVDKEERFQKSFGGILQKVIAMGGETGSEVLSRQAKTILAGVGAKTFQGGAIKGGYGLKQQSFKDMPKTQIMTDDNGRPFVGYKAMRGGKPVYVRGPQPGQGTSNPFEMLGRAINPGAYKDIDARNERKKYEEASKNSISSLKARGASQATISKRQAELKKGVKPLPKPKPKPFVAAGGGMGGRRGSGSSPSTGSKPPSFSPTHSRGTRTAQATLGVNK